MPHKDTSVLYGVGYPFLMGLDTHSFGPGGAAPAPILVDMPPGKDGFVQVLMRNRLVAFVVVMMYYPTRFHLRTILTRLGPEARKPGRCHKC